MATAYFATRLTENISQTPEGFLLCKDAVIARTGYQKYKVKSLNQDRARELGIDTSVPDALLDLYRPSEEVFAPATLASFEGKSFTLRHPQDLRGVTAENVMQLERGHVQNVRKGWESLSDGEWPIIADIMIKDSAAISEVVDQGMRELSCGYEYYLDRVDGRLVQKNIIGNHIALVDHGRAGPEVQIYDHSEEDAATQVIEAPVEIMKNESTTSQTADKPIASEKKPGSQVGKTFQKGNRMNLRAKLIGLGLKALAADADPEELTAAMKEAGGMDSESEEEKQKKAADRAKDEEERKKQMDSMDKRAKDAEEDREREKKRADDAEEKMRTMDAASKEPGHYKACSVKDCMDRDCGLHRGLDSIIEKHPKAEGEDADIESLKEILGEFLNEEEAEPEHQDEGEAQIIEPIGAEGTKGDATDRVSAEDQAERADLASIRKEVADSKNPKLIESFNRRVAALNRRLKKPGTAGGYDSFARGAATVSDDADIIGERKPTDVQIEEAYAKFHKGGK